MKDASKEVLERDTERLVPEAAEWVGFSLRKLYADKSHTLGQEVVYGLTFEELIGALLAARGFFRRVENVENEE
jgi:hypothetical protein